MLKFLSIICIIPAWLYCVDLFNDLVTAYEKYGDDKYMIEEEIIQRSHVLQAAYIARLAGAPEDAIIGLLFHDIGQIIDESRVGQTDYLHAVHDEVGAKWLHEQGFPQNIVDWVRFHTIAKIVLCMEDPNYYDYLSEASKISYQIQKEKYLQGDRSALHAFDTHPLREEYLRMRKCDDMAKIADFNEGQENGGLPGFESYSAMLARVLAGEGALNQNPDWKEKIDALHTMMCANRLAFEALIRQATNN